MENAAEIKLAKEMSNGVQAFYSNKNTYLTVIAIHKDAQKNHINSISCVKGISIPGYAYNSQTDSYIVECFDYLHLGCINGSFFVKIKGSSWEMRVPMTENIIKKLCSPIQKQELKNFKARFKLLDYEIQYLQILDSN